MGGTQSIQAAFEKVGGAFIGNELNICSRNDDTATREANDKTTIERGPRPADYTEPWPQDPAPIQQNQTPITIACCANVSNIIGSQVTSSTISQYNNCLEDRKNAVKTAEQAAAEKVADTPEQAAAEKVADTPKAAKDSEAAKAADEKVADTTKAKNQKMILVLVLVIILLLLSSSSITSLILVE